MSFKPLNHQLPSDQIGVKFYKGVVVDNNDPLHLDRVKAYIPELYDQALGPIPWICPIKQSMFGQGKGFGSFGVPPIGSILTILLQNNDPNFPLYVGYFLTQANSKQLEPGVYQLIDENQSVLEINTIDKSFNYHHCSGIDIRLQSGSININALSNINIEVRGSANIKAESANIETSGNIVNKCSTFIVQASEAQLKCPVKTGNLSNIYSSGGTGATIKGGIANTGGQISSNGIVLESHTHGQTQPGNGSTGGPQ